VCLILIWKLTVERSRSSPSIGVSRSWYLHPATDCPCSSAAGSRCFSLNEREVLLWNAVGLGVLSLTARSETGYAFPCARSCMSGSLHYSALTKVTIHSPSAASSAQVYPIALGGGLHELDPFGKTNPAATLPAICCSVLLFAWCPAHHC
jgi:hypothetical protein